MIRYAFTIFLSAFLLFQIQPMIARAILPWFGGTAAVWTTCMMFFQITLLLGYTYAHLSRIALSQRTGWIVHSILLGTAACFANVMPDESLQPAGNDQLTWSVLKTLFMTIGLPFFVLSTTGPLVQAWQNNSHPDRSPYRLYALSNLGSMLALVSYPFIFERFWTLDHQVGFWRINFLLFCGLCCWSGYGRRSSQPRNNECDRPSPSLPTNRQQLAFGGWLSILWILLAMAASILLLATTNLLCQEVASVPFLWILPLSLYLLSFIICFDQPGLYRRRIFMPLLVVSSMLAIVVVHLNVHASFVLQISVLATVCFAGSMVCHGELERLKPQPSQLTGFYLLVSVGGSAGGIFVAVIAPLLFDGFYEFQIGLLICLLVPLIVLFFEKNSAADRPVDSTAKWLTTIGILFAASLAACSLMYFLDPSFHPNLRYQARNEYGLISVIDEQDYRQFINGRIEHGGQFLGGSNSLKHSSYYGSGSGVGIAFEAMRKSLEYSNADRGLHVGVLGLGAGGMMTWGQAGDSFVFYEINPLVEQIAHEYFTFLKDSPATSEVVLGDGRLQLEFRAREIELKRQTKTGTAKDQNQSSSLLPKFDLLFMDAFASDSIPLHLLTEECFWVYLRNMNPNGILVAHITNRFVDLRPVVYQQAIDSGLTPILVDCDASDDQPQTRWVLMTSNPAIINSLAVRQSQCQWPVDMQPIKWTDDHASLAEVLDWTGTVDWKRMQEMQQIKRNKMKKTE